MLCAPVFIFTSGSSAILGLPRCSLSIWLSLLAIFKTPFWVYADYFYEKTDKTRRYSKSVTSVWYENGRRRLLGAQSTNTKSLWNSQWICPLWTKENLQSSNGKAWKGQRGIYFLDPSFVNISDRTRADHSAKSILDARAWMAVSNWK